MLFLYIIEVKKQMTMYNLLGCLFFQENVDPPCEITERRIFTMAQQVASALVSMKMHFLLSRQFKCCADIQEYLSYSNRAQACLFNPEITWPCSSIRSSFTAKIFSTEIFVPATYWSARTTRPSSGVFMGSTRGKTRGLLTRMIPA